MSAEHQSQDRISRTLAEKLRGWGLSEKKVALGVSGGADSVALLLATCEVAAELRLTPVVLHFNHRIRGEAADVDERWVAELCERLEVEFRSERAAVPVGPVSLEERAREQRYKFFARVMHESDCCDLLLAHHADDQVETVLHHIVRGSGLSGLRGMPEKRELVAGCMVYRPLLELLRADLLGFLKERQQDFREDATNADPAWTRNRIRHQLLPELREHYNSAIDQSLLRLSRQAAETTQFIGELAEEILAQALVQRRADLVKLDRPQLRKQSPFLLRAMFHELWQRVDWPRKRMGFAEYSRLAESVFAESAHDLPDGVRVSHRGQLMILERVNV